MTPDIGGMLLTGGCSGVIGVALLQAFLAGAGFVSAGFPGASHPAPHNDWDEQDSGPI